MYSPFYDVFFCIERSEIGMESGGPPLISFKELEIATEGWNAGAILGKGGFGTVYKGIWKNTHVAVKRTRSTDADENQNIQIQVWLLLLLLLLRVCPKRRPHSGPIEL